MIYGKRLAKSAGLMFLCLLTASSVVYAGNASSANFLILTSSDTTSLKSGGPLEDTLLRQAEIYREKIAMDLFGKPLPDGLGRTLVNYSHADRDRGLTWAADSHRRSHHVIYLSGDPETTLLGPLRHEMVHVLLATQFPGDSRLPAWIEEGLASRYDSANLIRQRRAIVQSWHRHGSFPDIKQVLTAENIAATDAQAYTVSATLIDYLLENGGRERLFAFAVAIQQDDVDQVLADHYRIKDTAALERRWQSWLRSQARLASASR